jgi:protein involved in ribonucleotide reduction
VYFSSVTEFTHKFVEKLGLPAVRIPLKSSEAESFIIEDKFVLITPTYGASGKGFVPLQVVKFLNQEKNRENIIGVIGSGNINFFEDYAKAANVISVKTNVPVLYKFELAGTTDDVNNVRKGIIKFWNMYSTTTSSTQN